MSTMLFALALALQSQSATPPPRTLPSGIPPREMTPSNEIFYEREDRTSPNARIVADRFGACVADRSPELSARTLRLAFNSTAYHNNMRNVTRANEGCMERRGRMRSASLLVAGAMAERLLEREPTPINVQLARGAEQPAPRAVTPSDAIALCMVRSTPDDVARLFASEVASDGEAQAAEALMPVANLCNESGRTVQLSNGGLRAMLATAAFRTAQSGAATGVTRD